MTEPELRNIDQTVLHHIQQGHNDTQKITAETTLKTHKVRYSLEKLEQLGLITIEQPDTMVERVVDGQKRVFQHPKQAQLSEKGRQYLENSSHEDLDEYENLSHRELVERVQQLEFEMNRLEKHFEIFQSQIKQKL
jgi:predicted transcriptional regulator